MTFCIRSYRFVQFQYDRYGRCYSLLDSPTCRGGLPQLLSSNSSKKLPLHEKIDSCPILHSSALSIRPEWMQLILSKDMLWEIRKSNLKVREGGFL